MKAMQGDYQFKKEERGKGKAMPGERAQLTSGHWVHSLFVPITM
jgi:hypothetical protein